MDFFYLIWSIWFGWCNWLDFNVFHWRGVSSILNWFHWLHWFDWLDWILRLYFEEAFLKFYLKFLTWFDLLKSFYLDFHAPICQLIFNLFLCLFVFQFFFSSFCASSNYFADLFNHFFDGRKCGFINKINLLHFPWFV